MVSGSEEASEGLVMGIESFSILHHLSISTTLSLLRYLLPNVSDLHIYVHTHRVARMRDELCNKRTWEEESERGMIRV